MRSGEVIRTCTARHVDGQRHDASLSNNEAVGALRLVACHKGLRFRVLGINPFWVDVAELKLSYRNQETSSLTTSPYSGNKA